MSSDKTLMVVAVIAVIVSVLGVVMTAITYSSFNDWLVMFAPTANQTEAIVNVTIQTNLVIKFTNDSINWGGGFVDSANSFKAANLTSEGRMEGWVNKSAPNVTNGFVLENVGNLNATLYIKTDKNATGFIMSSLAPSTGIKENFTYKVTSCNNTLATDKCSAYRGGSPSKINDTFSSCGGASITLGTYREVNASVSAGAGYLGDKICDQFGWEDTADELKIDIGVIIPVSAPANAKGAIMTATAECPFGNCGI